MNYIHTNHVKIYFKKIIKKYFLWISLFRKLLIEKKLKKCKSIILTTKQWIKHKKQKKNV